MNLNCTLFNNILLGDYNYVLKTKMNLKKFLISSLSVYLVLLERELNSNNIYAWGEKATQNNKQKIASSKGTKWHVL